MHGMALGRASCGPGLAIPLARNGYLALAIDECGHGRSGGGLARQQLDTIAATLDTQVEPPEVEAAIDFLKKEPRADPGQIVLVGHSLGALAAINAGHRHPQVRGVVCIGAAGGNCDRDLPHNLLILGGGKDRLCSVSRCARVLAQATGVENWEPPAYAGDFAEGNRRGLLVVSRVNHFTELADPGVTRRVVQWFGSALSIDAGPVSGWWLIGVTAAVLTASAGGVLVSVWALRFLAHGLLPVPGRVLANAATLSGRRTRLALFLVMVPALVAGIAAVERTIELGPVCFALPSAALFAGLAIACLLVVSRPSPAGWHAFEHGTRQAVRGLILGTAALVLAFAWLNFSWGATWWDLVPTPRRLQLVAILIPILVPVGLLLALGFQRLGGHRRPDQLALAQGLAWLAVPAALWLGYILFADARHPLFAVPVWFTATSFIVPFPLWLLPNRPGMTWARGIAHAGAAAWLLGCHLPFVGRAS
jgi:dienelactone hydrolase